MSKQGKQILGFFGGVLVVLIIAWLGGFNFDSRGLAAAYVFGVSLVAGFLGGSYPYSDD